MCRKLSMDKYFLLKEIKSFINKSVEWMTRFLLMFSIFMIISARVIKMPLALPSECLTVLKYQGISVGEK